MGIRVEWADNREVILKFTIEAPWTWKEYLQWLEPSMAFLKAKGTPCATVVDVSKMGYFPKDGNVIQILLLVERLLPETVFASTMIGSPAIVVAFMNVVTKLRPRAKRLVHFTRTEQEAYNMVYGRYESLYPDRPLPPITTAPFPVAIVPLSSNTPIPQDTPGDTTNDESV